MGIMGIQGISPGPNLSKRLHAQYLHPYLLRNLKVDHPDQVWAVDITYIRLRQGFMYLFVIELLQTEGIKISMDGKGRALDNIFVERFFRTLKYENIYLNEYETPKSLRKGLNKYIQFYNEQRLHGSLGYRYPVDFYHQNLDQLAS